MGHFSAAHLKQQVYTLLLVDEHLRSFPGHWTVTSQEQFTSHFQLVTLSGVSACPSTLFAIILVGPTWEQLMDVSQV